ncbi:hypothetical protein J4209_05685 [Candidatus Woesearchaeota archaeon]|nr:hypothetical protein [Candidatus Woesearchaeota archaeon]
MVLKKTTYLTIIVLLVLTLAFFVIRIIQKPKSEFSCVGMNDPYMHCLGLVGESDAFCDSEEWAKDPYELQKDKDFCRYFMKYKEAILKEDRGVCLEIMDFENFKNYNCSSDYFGCPSHPLNCYITMSKDSSVCNELDNINITGFPLEEKQKYCNTVFELEKTEKFYETETFQELEGENKSMMVMIISIRRKDPSLCEHADKLSRDFITCQIYSTLRKSGKAVSKKFCNQFLECTPKEGSVEIKEIKGLQ